jgi:hypothetical protein
MGAAVNIPDLRPLSLGELLDRTFTYYRRHFWLFVGIMALPQVFVVGANLCVTAIETLTGGAQRVEGDGLPTAAALGGAIGFLAGVIVMVVAYWLLYSMALGATAYAISGVHLGKLPTVRESYRSMKGQVLRIIDLLLTVGIRIFGVMALSMVGFVAIILTGAEFRTAPLVAVGGILLAVAGMAASVVLAIWLVLRYGVSVPALVLEKLRAKEAIRRSVFLTKGNLGRVFLIGLLMTLVSATVSGLLQGPFLVATMVVAIHNKGAAPFWLNIPTAIAGGIGQALTGPLLMIGLALLYYDTRVRKEGLDLQLIMEALDRSPDQPLAP